jgi:hypothetical protein
MRIVQRRDIFDERILEVEIVGAMHPLQPGRQSVQIESDDVSLPFVRRVVLGEYVRELGEVRLSLVFRECFLCAWDSTTDRQQQQGDHGSTHRASRSSVWNYSAYPSGARIL